MADANMHLVLASTSATRAKMLRDAGLSFAVEQPAVDEAAVQRSMTDAAAIAVTLAAEKALAVSRRRPADLVIGADQTLDCGDVFTKPADRAAAAAQLARLAGREHRLHTAVAVARDDSVVWQHLATVALTVRALGTGEIERYLDRAGDAALASVGAYQVEGLGIQLFEAIDGDWFTILGLPLLPLLAYLRNEGHVRL
jgi:septum formation protein